ncbi:transposable element Tcb2 transposase [Trichonephila clavipes]|nr:transposable element Tcb2 transposase [Trichonephila clavipes]
MRCYCLQYTVTPSIDLWHHDRLAVCPCHPATTCVATHATASRNHIPQDNARPHTTRVSHDCIRTVTTLPCPTSSPNLSPSKHIWDHLGWQVSTLTSLNELEARLQQIWNELSQDI